LLFDGAAGTGKTAASKYIAQKFGVPLYHLDLGAMKGKYVGESEGNLIAALTQVDQVEPCVVILDEVEKIFQNSGDSGVTSGLLSQLLWWLQEHKTQVFTVMTTNNRLAIPPELYREGRIDAVMVFMGLEDFNTGYEFGKGALDRMATEVGIKEVPAKVYQTLSKRLKTMFAGSPSVPQVKVIQAVHELVKELLAQGKEVVTK
jgi:SpoVK/Ycf46/Vps4 family AAA+-type ATPase